MRNVGDVEFFCARAFLGVSPRKASDRVSRLPLVHLELNFVFFIDMPITDLQRYYVTYINTHIRHIITCNYIH